MSKIKKILRIEESELLKCISFGNSFAKNIHISFEMDDGIFEKIDYETFQKCIRNYLHTFKNVNFARTKFRNKVQQDYKFCEPTESTAHFAINKGNGYIKVFRNLDDPDIERYYDILFSVPNCSTYTINEIWKIFNSKIVLGEWLDLSPPEKKLLWQYFEMLNN